MIELTAVELREALRLVIAAYDGAGTDPEQRGRVAYLAEALLGPDPAPALRALRKLIEERS